MFVEKRRGGKNVESKYISERTKAAVIEKIFGQKILLTRNSGLGIVLKKMQEISRKVSSSSWWI